MTPWRRLLHLAVLGASLAPPAAAQIRGPLGGGVVGGLPDVGQTLGRTTRGVLDETNGLAAAALDPEALAAARARRLAEFVGRNRRVLETDPAGDPVVRGEVVAIDPTPGALAAAEAAGFSIASQTTLGELGLRVTIIGAPQGMSVTAALRRLRQLDPSGDYDFDHLYFGAGSAAGPAAAAAGASGPATGARLGLIDTGVAANLPMFAGVAIEERGFAPGAPVPAAHGTATASLISGRLRSFHGAAPGARLYVADIYGGSPTGGSAAALASALEWMAEIGAPVVNVSLVGPPNAVVAAAVKALSARGARIVAAVGNDGPAAPPAYPASYPDVVAVTPVDARGHVLPEAGRALHVDFAAPGAGLEAAALGGGLAPVRGASFAAPIVAGRLSLLLRREDPAAASAALSELAGEARRAGREAGRGVIGEDVLLADRR